MPYGGNMAWFAFAVAALLVAGALLAERLGRRRLRNTARFAAAFAAAALYLKLLVLLHPSMPTGEAVFQAHRFEWVLSGRYFFTSIAPGGFQVPHAIGLYVFAAPWTLLGHGLPYLVSLLRIVVATADTLAGLLLYLMVLRASGDRVAGAMAAALFHLVPLGMTVQTTGHLTNAFGQSWFLATLGLVSLGVVRQRATRGVILATAAAVVAALSHGGTFVIAVSVLVLVAASFAWRGNEVLRTSARPIATVALLAGAIAIAVYYAHFWETYREQAARIASELGQSCGRVRRGGARRRSARRRGARRSPDALRAAAPGARGRGRGVVLEARPERSPRVDVVGLGGGVRGVPAPRRGDARGPGVRTRVLPGRGDAGRARGRVAVARRNGGARRRGRAARARGRPGRGRVAAPPHGLGVAVSQPPPPGTAGGSRLARSAGTVGLATMASRVLGLLRDVVFASLFGAGDQMDAFRVAFRIPNLVRDLFAEGAMSAAFIPTFTRHLQRHGKDGAWRLGNLVISMLLVVTGVVALVGMLTAGPLTRVFASSYAAVPGKLELTITLTRVMFPFLVMVAAAVAFMGMLNSLRHFFVPALSPAMFNVGAIFAAFAFVPAMAPLGWPPTLGLAIRHAARRHAAGGGPVACAAPRGVPVPLRAGAARPGHARGAPADDPWHGGPRRGADQHPRQHDARDGRGHRRGVVARLRVPADVPAHRPLRRLGGDGGAPDRVRLRGAQRHGRACGAPCPAGSG